MTSIPKFDLIKIVINIFIQLRSKLTSSFAGWSFPIFVSSDPVSNFYIPDIPSRRAVLKFLRLSRVYAVTFRIWAKLW
jgi:hypothetical protein